MNWEPLPQTTPLPTYQWSGEELDNGWTPGVSDHSQTMAPRKATSYFAFATCRWWIVHCGKDFGSFAEAKQAAEFLAYGQKTACSYPDCIVRNCKPKLNG